MRSAAFLDRDGTIIYDRGYLSDPEGVELLPGAVEFLQRLRDAGLLLVIISNQSAVGRGMCTTDDVDAVNARLAEVLAPEGIRFDGVYYCPHAPDDGCACRKPLPGLLEQAARDLDIDVARSAMVGDSPRDAEAGRRAGCAVNVLLGVHDETLEAVSAGDLHAAAQAVLSGLGLSGQAE
jgi:D-glycero-D-manno-heptose 1,7-bisphosphate phosphatase